MDKESVDFNLKMFQAWQEHRSNWRIVMDKEDQLLERCEDQVLSPKNESKEGREKLRRREKAQKAGKLSESWKFLK